MPFAIFRHFSLLLRHTSLYLRFSLIFHHRLRFATFSSLLIFFTTSRAFYAYVVYILFATTPFFIVATLNTVNDTERDADAFFFSSCYFDAA